MPRVFRVMKKESDGLPKVGPADLGVRPSDVDVDAQNNILVNGKGMSVAPEWQDININRIPKRLRLLMPGAGGANSSFCFCFGTGPFSQGPFANALTLEPDLATHGNVAPELSVPLATYEADLAATRPDWEVVET